VSRARLVAAFAAIYVLWGSNFLAIRYAAEAVPPLLLMGVRSLLAGGILFAWARRGGARPGPGHWRSALATGLPLFLGCHGLLAWAEQSVPSGLAALVLATIPVWMTLLDWAAGGPPPGTQAAGGLALGFAGLAWLVGPVHQEAPRLGLAALVAAAFAWASGSILSRRLPLPGNLALATGMQLLAGGAALLLGAAVLGESPAAVRPTPRALAGFAYMVGVASLVGFTAYSWLLRVSTPARVGTYAFVNPLVALAVGRAIGGEVPGPRTLVASAAILVGVALLVLAPRGVAPRPSREAFEGGAEVVESAT